MVALRLLTTLAVFTAGYLWGGDALAFVSEYWEAAREASRIKFERLF